MIQSITTLRRAEPADLDVIKQLTEAAYAPHTALLGAPPLPVTENYDPRIEAGQVWLATTSNEVVGLLVLEHHQDHTLVFSVAVLPERQKDGHGLMLLRFAEDQAKQRGVHEIRLYTNSRMERNIALYTALGYREAARRPHPYRPGWVLVDMTKPIS